MLTARLVLSVATMAALLTRFRVGRGTCGDDERDRHDEQRRKTTNGVR
jgi:hypothetical protein